MSYKALLLASALAFSNAVFAAEYEAIAAKGCECVAEHYEDMLEMLSKYEEAKGTGDDSKVEAVENDMMPLMKNVQSCIDDILEATAQDEEGQEKVFAMMDEECPEPAL